MWYGIDLFFLMAASLATLAWLNHRHFDKIFDLMDGRLEKMIGTKDRRGEVSYQVQKHLATAVLVFFSLEFLWYFVKSLRLAFGWGS
ncbi:hypothetical protein [Nocardiopsis aegyptia]|uniref:Uncharacterized protein n=1 Tax=Nocardiopsis aegyptia TaxID=220378 RepID=A0A7Z0EJV4_9ACTN|nr:hypothetical protein [Nocardiopsis aegyptia]NYJ32593.1 hypothetical protein [Nocardiopsis aegyptia]